MNKETLQRNLAENHKCFVDYIKSLTHEEFLYSQNQKWTAGQQIEHIYLSVKPVRQALSIPKFIVRLMFGKANRPSRTYDDLMIKYLKKLAMQKTR